MALGTLVDLSAQTYRVTESTIKRIVAKAKAHRRVLLQLGWPQSHSAILRAAELRPHSSMDRISGVWPFLPSLSKDVKNVGKIFETIADF